MKNVLPVCWILQAKKIHVLVTKRYEFIRMNKMDHKNPTKRYEFIRINKMDNKNPFNRVRW